MNITEFAFRLIILFLPGIIIYTLIDALTNQKEHKTQQAVVYSILYGLSSYITYFIIIKIITALFFLCTREWYNIPIHLFDTISKNQGICFPEIAVVSFISVILGFFLAYVRTHKWLHRIAHHLNITRKHGDIDCFSFFVWSKNLKSPWVIVRDFQHDWAYFGWLAAHSVGTSERDELLLFDVTIYENISGNEVRKTPSVYIPLKRENLVIEFLEVDYNKWGEH